MKHPFHASRYSPPFDSVLHRLDGRVKLILAMATVVVIVLTPPEAYATFAVYAGLLAVSVAIARIPLGYLLARWLIVLPFVAAAAVAPLLGANDVYLGPLGLSYQGLIVLWNVAIKAILSVTAMTVLISSTHFSDLLSAMERLGTPRTVVMLVAVTYRYLFILADEAHRMLRARNARAYADRWVWQAATVGRMVGTLFLRSYERGERVHSAMLARGFEGAHIVASHPVNLETGDVLVGIIYLLLLAAIRISAIWTSH